MLKIATYLKDTHAINKITHALETMPIETRERQREKNNSIRRALVLKEAFATFVNRHPETNCMAGTGVACGRFRMDQLIKLGKASAYPPGKVWIIRYDILPNTRSLRTVLRNAKYIQGGYTVYLLGAGFHLLILTIDWTAKMYSVVDGNQPTMHGALQDTGEVQHEMGQLEQHRVLYPIRHTGGLQRWIEWYAPGSCVTTAGMLLYTALKMQRLGDMHDIPRLWAQYLLKNPNAYNKVHNILCAVLRLMYPDYYKVHELATKARKRIQQLRVAQVNPVT